MTRDEVLIEFAFRADAQPWGTDMAHRQVNLMADEIVRLRELVERTEWEREQAWQVTQQQARTLAALREPSEAVIVAAEDAMDTASATDCVPGDWNTAWVLEAIRAAVAAAEKETSTESNND